MLSYEWRFDIHHAPSPSPVWQVLTVLSIDPWLAGSVVECIGNRGVVVRLDLDLGRESRVDELSPLFIQRDVVGCQRKFVRWIDQDCAIVIPMLTVGIPSIVPKAQPDPSEGPGDMQRAQGDFNAEYPAQEGSTRQATKIVTAEEEYAIRL